jgi:hypothetical protein
MIIDAEESKALQEFRRGLFGNNAQGETMPLAYLGQLSRLVTGADATLGIRRGDRARTAFWLSGNLLGHLACVGVTDEDAEIQGWAIRLDGVSRIDIEVRVIRGDGDDPDESGRILKIDGNILLDATPGSAHSAKLTQIEQFIDQVLGVFAG